MSEAVKGYRRDGFAATRDRRLCFLVGGGGFSGVWLAKVTGFKLKQRYVVFLCCRFPLFSGRDQRGQLGGRFSVCFVVQRVFWLAKGTVCWERAVSVANCRGRQQSGCFLFGKRGFVLCVANFCVWVTCRRCW